MDEEKQAMSREERLAAKLRENLRRRKAMSREERLAAKLRENLRRRKAQARALRPDDTLPKEQDDG